MDRIVFTRNIGAEFEKATAAYQKDQIFIVTDTNTFVHCLPCLDARNISEEKIVIIKEGEDYKSLESVIRIWSVLSEKGARRNAVLVNVGGGLVTDIGGFAASCFKRGIRCLNIPTTLLSQVDASVGGKTGINFHGLKNEIGTFALPEKVLIDVCFLKTLPSRQILSGFAEMLKHALLKGGSHFERILEVNLRKFGGSEAEDLIRESVAIKSGIVTSDPRENGIRKALNFGHTVGHALESMAIEKHREWYHGDAVAYGMIAELYLSVQKMGFDPTLYERIRAFIKENYPSYKSLATGEELYALMLHDKKNEREGVNFTLLRQPGKFVIDNYCSREEILQALEELSR